MHAFPEKKLWICYGLTHDCICLDMGFETLKLKFRELEVRPISLLILWISEGLTPAQS